MWSNNRADYERPYCRPAYEIVVKACPARWQTTEERLGKLLGGWCPLADEQIAYCYVDNHMQTWYDDMKLLEEREHTDCLAQHLVGHEEKYDGWYLTFVFNRSENALLFKLRFGGEVF